MRTVVLWDIDGTLLTTTGTGLAAWEGALAEVCGVEGRLDGAWMHGLTDVQIARELLARSGGDAARVDSLVGAYERRLPAAIAGPRGHVLPNVLAILADLRARPQVDSLLLTGNTRAGAAAKLARYGLTHAFRDGAFADGCADRVEVARRAHALATAGGPARLFVVGDTPHDIHCARVIGARAIAVATGRFARAELEAHEPWRALDELPAPDEFARLLELPPQQEQTPHAL